MKICNIIANRITIVIPIHRKEVITLQVSEMEGTLEGSNTTESIRCVTGKWRRQVTTREKLGRLIAKVEQVLQGVTKLYEEAYK